MFDAKLLILKYSTQLATVPSAH